MCPAEFKDAVLCRPGSNNNNNNNNKNGIIQSF